MYMEFIIIKGITDCCLFWERYAKDLVNIMFGENGPDVGAASDGMVRCMITTQWFQHFFGIISGRFTPHTHPH